MSTEGPIHLDALAIMNANDDELEAISKKFTPQHDAVVKPNPTVATSSDIESQVLKTLDELQVEISREELEVLIEKSKKKSKL